MKGMADGSGLSYKTVFRAYHHPSVGLILIPKLIKKLAKGFKRTGICLNACSSFAVKDDYTHNRELIIGRNMDYSGIEAFPNNINSVVFLPEQFKFWIAVGPAPSSNNRYIGFDFWSIFKGKPLSIDKTELPAYRFKDNKKKSAMQVFSKAHILHEENPDKKQEIKVLLHKAMAHDKTEIIFYYILCKMLIHEGSYTKALSFIQNIQQQKQSLNENTHSLLLLGICNDLSGERVKGLE